MASLTWRDHKARIQVIVRGKRHAIRLSPIGDREARRACGLIEDLAAAVNNAIAPAPRLIDWLRELSPDVRGKLAKAGLVPASIQAADVPLENLLDRVEDSIAGMKPSTRTHFSHVRRNMETHFGKGRRVPSITHEDADKFASWLRNDCGLARATANRRVRAAATVFRRAVRWSIIDKSPFEGVKAGGSVNRERTQYVPPNTVAMLVEATPDPEWKALLALGRWLGLRVQSEGLGLRLTDLDWERQAVWVRSPKTEGHEGHEGRWVPMFPEARPHLLRLHELAEDGQVYLFNRGRFASGNLRTGMLKLIKRAGLKPWPRLWHNLRASRATELAADYPMATAAAWLGHGVKIMAEHYVTSIDASADFDRATGRAAQNVSQNVSHSGALTRAQRESASGPTGTEDRAQTVKLDRLAPRCAPMSEDAQVGGDRVSVGQAGVEPALKGF